jgi:hypothetical protein
MSFGLSPGLTIKSSDLTKEMAMHPDLLQELNELHLRDLHRGAARTRFTHPIESIRRLRARATTPPATLAKKPGASHA